MLVRATDWLTHSIPRSFVGAAPRYTERRVLDHRMEVLTKLPNCPVRFTGRKGQPATGFAVLTDQVRGLQRARWVP